MPKHRLRQTNTLVIAGAAVVGLYLVVLVGTAYVGQEHLRSTLSGQERLLLSQQAAHITKFLDAQRDTLRRLSRATAIQAYVDRRNHPMSSGEDLQSHLLAVGDALQRAARQARFEGRRIFRHIRLVDPVGRTLVDALSGMPEPVGADDPATVAPPGDAKAGDDEPGSALELRAAIPFGADRTGYLIAEIGAETILSPLMKGGGAEGRDAATAIGRPHAALLDANGSVVAHSLPAPHADRRWQPSLTTGDRIAHPLGPYGLSLVALPDPRLRRSLLTSPVFLGAMAAIAAPWLVAVAWLWGANKQRLILRTRLEGSRRQRRRLRRQNERLRDEIDRHIASEQELTNQANYDQLTGLPNRNLALDRLEQAIRWARRDHNRVLALFIDLDRFKQVNDLLGHAAGDDLLREAARRLLSGVRERDTVARLSGDEFLVICTDIDDRGSDAQIAQSLLQSLAAPFYIGDHELFVGGSIGMASYPDGGDTPHKLLKSADIAMYAAKERGRNAFALYDPTMDALAIESLRLERKLRCALSRDELYLVFQPIVDLASGRTIALEALMRWHNEALGEVPPCRFIPIAEESGLIHEMGEWALMTACQTLSRIDDSGRLRVSVNLSSKQFSRPSHLLDCVLTALRTSGLMPEQLEIEITESILIDDRRETGDLIGQLDRIGVRLALDDFGTGYSAINCLQRFPFDVLKIDRTFTRQTPNSEANASLIKAIIAVAHALGLEVVAEGIEQRQQAGFLLVYHCEFGQGSLYSKPLRPAQLVEFLREDAAALTA